MSFVYIVACAKDRDILDELIIKRGLERLKEPLHDGDGIITIISPAAHINIL